MTPDTIDVATRWTATLAERSKPCGAANRWPSVRRAGVLRLMLLIFVAKLALGPSRHAHADDVPHRSRASEELRFQDLDNKPYTLKASADKQALVLIFVTMDCPIANSYQPLLNRLFMDFQRKGFEFVMVHEGPEQTPTKLREHASEYSVKCAVAVDLEHKIAHTVGATKTPEAFVLGRDGKMLYQGRIDNLHQGFGRKRSTATRDDLRIALTEIDSGEKVSLPKTESVGCSIPSKVSVESKR